MADPIQINEHITLDGDEIVQKAVRASGPGGQHVNKTSTAIELRFDARNSPSLPDAVFSRLKKLAGSRMTQDGVILLFAQGSRSQEMNRQEAVERLVDLLREAAKPPPPPRKKTKPTKASKERRLTAKKTRGSVKAMRGKPGFD